MPTTPTEAPRANSHRSRSLPGTVYLGYIVAWLFAVQSNQLIGIDDRFEQAMSRFGEFFAIVSPALWFFAALSLVRSPATRVVVLILWARRRCFRSRCSLESRRSERTTNEAHVRTDWASRGVGHCWSTVRISVLVGSRESAQPSLLTTRPSSAQRSTPCLGVVDCRSCAARNRFLRGHSELGGNAARVLWRCC